MMVNFAGDYGAKVTALNPLVYWRLGDGDKSDGATAVNLGSLDASGDGTYRDVVGHVADVIYGPDTAGSFGTTIAGGTTGDRVELDFGSVATPYPSSQLTYSIWMRSSQAGTVGIIAYGTNAAGANQAILFSNGSVLQLYINGLSVNTGWTHAQLFDGTWKLSLIHI